MITGHAVQERMGRQRRRRDLNHGTSPPGSRHSQAHAPGHRASAARGRRSLGAETTAPAASGARTPTRRPNVLAGGRGHSPPGTARLRVGDVRGDRPLTTDLRGGEAARRL
jgi:hypothetical protein